MGISISLTTRFCYWSVDKDSGFNTKKYLCFKHAVQHICKDSTNDVETEIVSSDDYWPCFECAK